MSKFAFVLCKQGTPKNMIATTHTDKAYEFYNDPKRSKADFAAYAVERGVILFGEEVADPEGGGVVKITQGLSTKYGPSRVRSTPISSC